MKNIDKFADNLMDETLKEAADTFFGKRKELEDDMDFLQRQVQKLHNQARAIEDIAARINYLLAGGKGAWEFWAGMEAKSLSDIAPEWEPDVALPRAWTRKGRFSSLVRNLYQQLADRIEVYTYGRYVEDQEVKGKKHLTSNLKSVSEFAESINAAIREINACSSPNDIMAFARSMDVEGARKKKFASSDLTYDYNQDLCFQELNLDELGLVKYPELSTGKEAMHNLAVLSKDIYSRYKTEINALLDEIYG
ncbi:hypothetical protein [Desulfonatronospira sp.]|uniref:hypothetical protein n=1 Tax=Desulfonatronospira sp. TaxID=1962951 RepID=UPI0025C19054|nr:hypothetical protein [Desulfonatronospira sp.]